MNPAVDEMAESGVLLHDEPMAKHTSWRVGGPADIFFKPARLKDLQSFLETLSVDTPVHWIGLGSNVLVRDGGIRGAVICTSALPRKAERVDDSRVQASAALPCTTLARRCARWRLGPAAFFAGIPGTVGGALAMNAGAFGGETWDSVESVQTIDRSGTLRVRQRSEFSVAYRSVSRPAEEWFSNATFKFDVDESGGSAEIKTMLHQRGVTQPLGRPSAGSVFRNPPGSFAGQLVESAGFKGRRVGGAMVSEKHANFIINADAATASDIEQLIEQIRSEVGQNFGVKLELEVRVLGERAQDGR